MTITFDENLTLRPLLVSDAPKLFQCIDANRTMLGTYLYWVKDVTDVESCRRYIDERANSTLKKRKWFGVYYHNELSGIFAIKSIDDDGCAELGYWLSEHMQGQSAVSRCVDYLKQERTTFGINALEFHCLSQNHASRRIAKKAGADYTSTIKDYFELDGVIQDMLIYRAVLAR